jgi:adenine-specific DNA-methyltransferase
LKSIRKRFGLRDEVGARVSLVFKDRLDKVYKVGLTEKDGRYNVEDTWNSNIYEDLDSNKIKRNAAEYTPHGSYLTQKPEKLLKRIIETSSQAGDVVADFFAGTGTTPAVSMKLGRRFVAVEMGEYFETDMLYRMKMVLNGRRVGISSYVPYSGGGFFKYIRLEAYEDTLNNLELRRRDHVQSLLDDSADVREDYLLHYMLELENRGSASLLDVDRLNDPFSYQLNITEAGESRKVAVDLVETFNWLLGLRVERVRAIRGYQTVEGTNPEGERVLVIWRRLSDPSSDDEALRRFFVEEGYVSGAEGLAFHRVYVNGDCTLATLRGEGERWEVMLTEEAFKRLMFQPAFGRAL